NIFWGSTPHPGKKYTNKRSGKSQGAGEANQESKIQQPMELRKLLLCTGLAMAAMVSKASAQDGHHILDGIGETGLISRHVFGGDARDWSRDTLHGRVYESEQVFVEDARFGKALSLSARDKTYVMLPGEAVEAEESLTITGWFYPRSREVGQLFFDFGQDGRNHFFLAPFGTPGNDGFQV